MVLFRSAVWDGMPSRQDKHIWVIEWELFHRFGTWPDEVKVRMPA